MKFREMWEKLVPTKENELFTNEFGQFNIFNAIPNNIESHATSYLITTFNEISDANYYFKGILDGMKLVMLLGIPEDLEDYKETIEDIEKKQKEMQEEYYRQVREQQNKQNPLDGLDFLKN